jgi:hypothetical protein
LVQPVPSLLPAISISLPSLVVQFLDLAASLVSGAGLDLSKTSPER